jgi:hypothetical protein
VDARRVRRTELAWLDACPVYLCMNMMAQQERELTQPRETCANHTKLWDELRHGASVVGWRECGGMNSNMELQHGGSVAE